MEQFLKYLESHDLRRVDGGQLTLGDDTSEFLHVAINPTKLDVEVVARDRAAQLVVVREGAGEVNVTVGDGARVNIVEVMCSSSSDGVNITQSANSVTNTTLLQLAESTAKCLVKLDGRGAECEFNILQLPTASERIVADLMIEHNVPNCISRSMSKCVAAGSSVGEFHGLVYVAEGAQQTSSDQSSRNVMLSRDAKIVAEPQLEIYADDVKCTHGATVGQMNADAILYMRQRGLSEADARRVQLDGFVADITNACAIDALRDELAELVNQRLHKI